MPGLIMKYFVLKPAGDVHYMRDGSDVIVCSHPLDVTEVADLVGCPAQREG